MMRLPTRADLTVLLSKTREAGQPAMKCAPRSLPVGSAAASHARALVALASVSCVVNVFDTTTKSVVAGSRPDNARVRCSGSTFETNATSMASVPAGSASQTRRGPRSEPPMPIWTTVRNGSPVAPLRRPSRNVPAMSRMRACVARMS